MSLATPAKPVLSRHGARPQRSPPRNAKGEMTCTHDDCRDEQPTFKRPCEYNKHMDKHERPYKCNNPACKKNPGFTYAGGLLRHQREVHNMHRTKEPFFCPHASCNRSTGTGFSRRENLDEHLRRRHSGISSHDEQQRAGREDNLALMQTQPQLLPLPLNRRRRRDADADVDSDDNDDNDDRGGGGDGDVESNDLAVGGRSDKNLQARFEALQEENARIRTELLRRDRMLAEVSHENTRLRNMLPPLPPHTLYRPPPLG